MCIFVNLELVVVRFLYCLSCVNIMMNFKKDLVKFGVVSSLVFLQGCSSVSVDSSSRKVEKMVMDVSISKDIFYNKRYNYSDSRIVYDNPSLVLSKGGVDVLRFYWTGIRPKSLCFLIEDNVNNLERRLKVYAGEREDKKGCEEELLLDSAVMTGGISKDYRKAKICDKEECTEKVGWTDFQTKPGKYYISYFVESPKWFPPSWSRNSDDVLYEEGVLGKLWFPFQSRPEENFRPFDFAPEYYNEEMIAMHGTTLNVDNAFLNKNLYSKINSHGCVRVFSRTLDLLKEIIFETYDVRGPFYKTRGIEYILDEGVIPVYVERVE